MRTVSSTASVGLYYLDEGDGPLDEALALARQQPDEARAGLWLATENDVVAVADMEEGYSLGSRQLTPKGRHCGSFATNLIADIARAP